MLIFPLLFIVYLLFCKIIYSMITKMTEAGQESKCPMCEARITVLDLEDEYTIDDYLGNNWISTKSENHLNGSGEPE